MSLWMCCQCGYQENFEWNETCQKCSWSKKYGPVDQKTGKLLDPNYEHSRCGGPIRCSYCRLKENDAKIKAHEEKTCCPTECWWCRGGEEKFNEWLNKGQAEEKTDSQLDSK